MMSWVTARVALPLRRLCVYRDKRVRGSVRIRVTYLCDSHRLLIVDDLTTYSSSRQKKKENSRKEMHDKIAIEISWPRTTYGPIKIRVGDFSLRRSSYGFVHESTCQMVILKYNDTT